MDGIWIALITGAVTLITSITSSILVFKSETKKTQANQEEKQQKQIDDLREMLVDHKKEYMSEIEEVKDSITQMQAVYQQSTAIINLKIDSLEKKQDQHNGLISRMYGVESSQKLLEEQLKVSNHRLSDVEEELKKK